MRIIATIGPNSSNKKILYGLINKGVDTLRLNFSHFYQEEFTRVLNDARSINNDIEIFADLSGKKIRVYEEIKCVYKVYCNEIVYFCSEDVYKAIANTQDTTMKLIPLTIKSKFIENNDIKVISMKDGTMNFDVLDKDKIFLKAKARQDGIVRGGKGCNIPGVSLGENILSEKDKSNIKWAIDNNVEILGQSYVESANEIIDIKEAIKSSGGDPDKVRIFSKIETNIGLSKYEEILNHSDGVIIARGDLIPECGIISSVEEEFNLLNKLNNKNHNKEVIIATHILDSMKNGNSATINEVESIYTFIRNGVNGFLLAGETSVGRNPIKTVEFLRELINIYKIT